MPRKKTVARARRRQRPRRLLPRLLLGVVVAAFAAAAGWLLYLDRRIASTFEGRRFDVPAQVFAQPLDVYEGLAIGIEDLIVELERLGYRAAADVERSGTFARRGDRLELRSRRGGGAVALEFAGPRIARIDGDAGATALVELEPLPIGSVFAVHGEDRMILTPDATPSLLIESLIVVEDRNFESHPGFDIEGIARAMWANVRALELRQGGSTLTQQLVRSYFLSNERTVARKINEIAMAVLLELHVDKTELLNAYVNEIFLGQDGNRAIHGFALGSQFYFGKPLAELDSHELALLIAVIRGPSYYNPFRHPERARARRDRVLAQMAEFGVIEEAEHAAGARQPLGLARAEHRGGAYYPAFMDLVRRQLASEYGSDALEAAGLRVYTTLDPRRQAIAERALTRTLDRIERDRKLPPGELEGAVIVTRAQTGDVLALVGGRRVGLSGFNRALAAERPIGSLVKPVVYLTAFETGRYHLGSPLLDAPLPSSVKWSPRNFDGEPRGEVPAVRALAESLNLATARLGLAIGPDAVAARLGALAGRSAPPALPSLLLGAVEMNPLDVTTLYSVFQNGGFRTPPKAVAEVTDAHGASLSRYPIRIEQVADEALIAQIDSALRIAMSRGTGRRSPFAGRGIAGKTGTSDDGRDSWFVGFDGDIMVVAWVGYDDNRATSLSGSSAALHVFDALMADLGTNGFDVPVAEGVEAVALDFATGKRTSAACGDLVTVVVPVGADIAEGPPCVRGVVPGVIDRVRRIFR